MPSSYTYGPLKSTYFTNFEKIWIEGYCKESGKTTLSEVELITDLSKCSSETVSKKCKHLLDEAASFSGYVRDSFLKSWNRMLGYSVKTIQIKESLKADEFNGAKAASIWWIKEAPTKISALLSQAYFNEIVKECITNNPNVLIELKEFNPIKGHKIVEEVKKSSILEMIDKTKGKAFEQKLNHMEIISHEPMLRMFPEIGRFINTVSWVAETIKKVESYKNGI